MELEEREISPQEELEQRERALLLREMRLRAGQALTERALPQELLGALSYESEEALDLSVEAAERAFRGAVEKAVSERMRGEAPARSAAQRDAQDMNDEDYYNTMYRKGGR